MTAMILFRIEARIVDLRVESDSTSDNATSKGIAYIPGYPIASQELAPP
jgi:hypothetical protein